MRLYRCNSYEKDAGTVVSWHGSKAEAERELRHFQKERGSEAVGPESIEPTDIPTDKAGLLHWLNVNFNRDND